MKKYLWKKEVNKRYPRPTLRRKFLYKFRMFLARLILLVFEKKLRKVEFKIIISPGRTGTRSLGLKLNQLENVISRHEPRPTILNLAIEYRNDRKDTRKVLNSFLARRGLYLFKAYRKKLIYIESNHTITFALEAILKGFENIQVVFITRDPMSYLNSAFSKIHGTKNKFNMHRFFDENDKRERITPNMLQGRYQSVDWENLSRFEKICWNYRIYHDEYLALLKKGYNIPLYHFEEIFKDITVFKLFIGSLGLDLENSDLNELFKSLQTPLNSSEKHELEDFSTWSKEMQNVYNEIVEKPYNQFMVECNYDC